MRIPLDLLTHAITYLDITTEHDAVVTSLTPALGIIDTEYVERAWIEASRVDVCVSRDGKTVYTRINGVMHSLYDQPALRSEHGLRVWFRAGKIYRQDLRPSIIDMSTGYGYWVENDTPIRCSGNRILTYPPGPADVVEKNVDCYILEALRPRCECHGAPDAPPLLPGNIGALLGQLFREFTNSVLTRLRAEDPTSDINAALFAVTPTGVHRVASTTDTV